MIKFTHVYKNFQSFRAIDDLSFEIREGDFCVLVGSSGSGKTTALKMINRLVQHDSGEIYFRDQNTKAIAPELLRRRMGYAIQSVGLFPHWTVEDNIASVPRLLHWPKSRIRERVHYLLNLLDLDAERLAKQYPHRLSGGQQQRVGVARALAADPDVLLMDEPFGALDPLTRSALQMEIRKIHQISRKTIVFVTHDIDEALTLADHIVLMDKGKIVQQGAPLALLNNPANDFVRQFFGGIDIGLRRLALEKVSEIVDPQLNAVGPSIDSNQDLRGALSLMIERQQEIAPVIDGQGKLIGAISIAKLTQRR